MMRASIWLVLLTLLLASPAAAQAPLIADLGGPLGFGTQTLMRDDDSVFAEVDITPTFPTGLLFFGTTATRIFVNNNGNVTLNAAVATFTPTTFAPGAPEPMIAAWWGDVDTRRVPTDANENLVYYAVQPSRVVITWLLVDYFSQHGDLRNSFQIVLTPAAGEPAGTLDVEFRYNRCEWTTGDASGGAGGFGGAPAAAGVDEGSDAASPSYLTLPGSRTMDVLRLCETSNVGETGVWRLQPRGDSIISVCGNFFVDRDEECDDGNIVDGDGCDIACRFERPDAGFDAGSEAGNDAGLDAGPPDGGIDAGRDAGPDVLSIGGGGCVCRAGVAHRGGQQALGLFSAMALVCVFRRRRSDQVG